MNSDAETGAPRDVALFPLHVVLFPGGLLPLRIFEPRYLRMVGECLREQSPFVVASIVDGPEVGGVATTAQSGTLVRIIDWDQGSEGLLELLCEGEQRARIDSVTTENDQLSRARVTALAVSPEKPLPDDLDWTADLLRTLLLRLGPPYERLASHSQSADHVANRLTELLPLPLEEKQALFDLDDSQLRLRRLAGLIGGLSLD